MKNIECSCCCWKKFSFSFEKYKNSMLLLYLKHICVFFLNKTFILNHYFMSHTTLSYTHSFMPVSLTGSSQSHERVECSTERFQEREFAQQEDLISARHFVGCIDICVVVVNNINHFQPLQYCASERKREKLILHIILSRNLTMTNYARIYLKNTRLSPFNIIIMTHFIL